MNTRTLRSPVNGLTIAQLDELDEAMSSPRFYASPDSHRYATLHVEYAVKAAHLLATNDLLGAQHAAYLAEHCQRTANYLARVRAETQDRLTAQRIQERLDPNGMLVAIKGSRRRVRIMPDDPWPDNAFGRDPLQVVQALSLVNQP